jgi:hypothetical protein
MAYEEGKVSGAFGRVSDVSGVMRKCTKMSDGEGLREELLEAQRVLAAYRAERSPAAESAARSALGLLRAVYNSKDLPLYMRVDAAKAAIPYELPKAGTKAMTQVNGLGERLETARKAAGLLVIEGSARPPGPKGAA